MEHVVYEQLVTEPDPELQRIFTFLDLEHEPGAVEYGDRFSAKKGPGDPISVEKHKRPVTDSLLKWAAELADDEAKLDVARDMIDRIEPADLATWGTPRHTVFDALEQAGGAAPPSRTVNAYTLQRRVLMALKKDIHSRAHGKLLKRVRYYCDVLLRE
jgi:hypothetical protein